VAVLILTLLQGPETPALLFNRARQDFEAGRYSEAQARLKEALKIAPQDAALWSYLGLAESKLNHREDAILAFTKACALDPRNPLNYFNLAVLHRQGGEYHTALDDYRKGLALNPDDPAANESYARILMETHRYREAVGPLERLKRISPSKFPLRLALVECYLKAGMNDQGEKEIQEFVKASGASMDDRLDLARLLVDNNQPDAARWVLEQVVQGSPDLADARAGLGIVLTDLGRYQDAAQQLAQAVRLAPGSAEYAMRYAEALLLAKHSVDALEYLKSVKARFGKLPEYRYKLGLAYYGSSMYESAIAELESLIRDFPHLRNLDRAEYYLGHCYSAAGDPDRAEIHYRKALALNPQEPSYAAALGHTLRRDVDAKIDEAIGYLEKAVQSDPSDILSKQDLALCYEKKGRYAEAEHLLLSVIQHNPRTVSAHRILARLYYREGKNEQGDRESAVVARLDAEELRRSKQMIDPRAAEQEK